MSDPMSFEWEGDTLRLVGGDDWREAVCPACGEPIRWVLDMLTFTSKGRDGHTLIHARCGWKPEAFRREERAARRLAAPPAASSGVPEREAD